MAIHPQGTYDAVIMNHGFCMSKGKNPKEQFWAQFHTDAGQITGYFYLTNDAAEHTIKKIRAMGYQGDDLRLLSDGQALFKNLCQITVQHDENEGKIYPKVGFVNPFGHQAGPKNDDVVAANAKRFNALLKSVSKVEEKKSDKVIQEKTIDFHISTTSSGEPDFSVDERFGTPGDDDMPPWVR